MAVLLTAFVTALHVTYAAGGWPNTGSVPTKPYTDLLTFSNQNYEEAFDSLDLNGDKIINTLDLEKHYYTTKSKFAIKKFTDMMVETSLLRSGRSGVNFEDFKKFMDRDPVKRQAYGVTMPATTELRRKFYADEILTYVYLVIDEKAIGALFRLIDTRRDRQLDLNEIQDMEVQLMNGNTKYRLSTEQAKLILAEMGGGAEKISSNDFRDYLLDGNLSFLFKECTSLRDGYDNLCLVRKIIHYSTRRLTEYMTTLVYDALDANPKNKKINLLDIKSAYNCFDAKARNFIAYFGIKSDEIAYSVFREEINKPEIRMFLENECTSGQKDEFILENRIDCLKKKLWEMAEENFSPRTIGVPDLDIIFLFEHLDASNDGVIEQTKDLEEGKRWTTPLASKFVDEIQSSGSNGKINLDDFMHYVYEPYMMFAIGGCQIAQINEKVDCYYHEMEDMMTNILTKSEVDGFFSYYEHKTKGKISMATLQQITPKMTGEEINNYLNELGMGNSFVDRNEFKYYVKQQDPSKIFVTDEVRTAPRRHWEPDQLHKKLLEYFKNFMTEFETLVLFSRLDKNTDYVINKSDIEKLQNAIDETLLRKMAVYGNEDHASYQEFWLFLNYKPSYGHSVRRQLEELCEDKKLNEKIDCFLSKLKLVK